MSLLFSVATFSPQLPWALMTLAPRWGVTRALCAPLAFPVLAAGVHFAVDAIGFQSPNATEELAKFAGVFDLAGASQSVPLIAFTDMLQNANFVTEEWAHVLAWDLFVGRWIWMDAIRRDVPLVRPSLLLCNFTGPPGLLLYLAICVLSGKGLPPSEAAGTAAAGGAEVALLNAAPKELARADEVVRWAFGASPGASVRWEAARIAAVCAEDVVWEDMTLEAPLVGRAAVYAHLSAREAEDAEASATISYERVADGDRASGFTFHRAKAGVEGRGLRGTAYVELTNDSAEGGTQGRIAYVRMGTEPLSKPGEATAKLLKAIAKPSAESEAASSAAALERRRPTTCSEIVRYLWFDVQASATSVVSESLDFFAKDVRYEDFNYEEAFVGKPAVGDFLAEFDIPGLTFVVQRVGDGDRACAFCWEVDLGLGESARNVKGISFYELDDDAQIAYVRDIPEPAIKPAPLPRLYSALGKLDPALKVTQPSAYEPGWQPTAREATSVVAQAASASVEQER